MSTSPGLRERKKARTRATIQREALRLFQRNGYAATSVEAIAEAALEECERFYPVFQFVLWGGKSPGEAIAAALIETAGEA